MLNKRVKLKSSKSFTFYIFIHDVPRLPKWDFDINNTPILMVDIDKDTYSRGAQFLVPDFYLIRKGDETVAKKVRDKADGMSR